MERGREIRPKRLEKGFSILIKHNGMKTKGVWRKIQLRLEMNSERGFKKSLKRSPRS
jgi:hypothetical protein